MSVVQYALTNFVQNWNLSAFIAETPSRWPTYYKVHHLWSPASGRLDIILKTSRLPTPDHCAIKELPVTKMPGQAGVRLAAFDQAWGENIMHVGQCHAWRGISRAWPDFEWFLKKLYFSSSYPVSFPNFPSFIIISLPSVFISISIHFAHSTDWLMVLLSRLTQDSHSYLFVCEPDSYILIPVLIKFGLVSPSPTQVEKFSKSEHIITP